MYNKIRKNSIYQEILTPILEALRVIGRAPFYRLETGELEYKYLSLVMLYSLAVFVSVGISSVMSIIHIQKRSKLNFNNLMDDVLVMIFIAPQLVLPISSWIECKSMQQYFKIWMKFQERYERIINKEFPKEDILKGTKRCSIWFLCSIVVIFIIIPIHMRNNIPWYHMPGYLFNMFGHMLFFTYWIISSRTIVSICHHYKMYLTKEIERDLGYTPMIEQYRLLWMSLSELSQKCGSTSAITLSLYILCTMMYLLVTLYNTAFDISQNIQTQDYYHLIAGVICSAFWLVVLMAYCDSGYQMSINCTEDILKIVLRIKDCNHWNYENEPRINIFLHTLTEYSPNVTVSGYFNINRALFGSIITTLVTYMIVLIQFNAGSEKSP